MKILIINGSPRKGNSDAVIKALIDIVIKENIGTTELKLRNIGMELPDGCVECANSNFCPNIKDEFQSKIMPTIPKYDGIIIVTPTHCNNTSVLIKIFIDRITPFCHPKRMTLKGKKIGIIAHGMANEKSWRWPVEWIKSVCTFHLAHFVGYYCFYSGAESNSVKFDKNKLEDFLKKFL